MVAQKPYTSASHGSRGQEYTDSRSGEAYLLLTALKVRSIQILGLERARLLAHPRQLLPVTLSFMSSEMPMTRHRKVYMCLCRDVHVQVRGNLQETIASLYLVGPRD